MGIMNNWSFWGVSVTGPGHLKRGVPNQDAWLARKYKWGEAVAVSDGLGSCPKSDKGSKAACLAVMDAARICCLRNNFNIEEFLRLQHAFWRFRISPHNPADCAATCLFVLRSAEVCFLGRLGDGMIAFLSDIPELSGILPDRETGHFSNQTHSLGLEFTPGLWQTINMKNDSLQAFLLCTDGISDDLKPEDRLDFVRSIYSNHLDMTISCRRGSLRNCFSKWPVPKHSDDKTAVCLFKEKGEAYV